MADDERKAVERVHATLSTLTPATARDDAIAFGALATATSGSILVKLEQRGTVSCQDGFLSSVFCFSYTA